MNVMGRGYDRVVLDSHRYALSGLMANGYLFDSQLSYYTRLSGDPGGVLAGLLLASRGHPRHGSWHGFLKLLPDSTSHVARSLPDPTKDRAEALVSKPDEPDEAEPESGEEGDGAQDCQEETSRSQKDGSFNGREANQGDAEENKRTDQAEDCVDRDGDSGECHEGEQVSSHDWVLVDVATHEFRRVLDTALHPVTG